MKFKISTMEFQTNTSKQPRDKINCTKANQDQHQTIQEASHKQTEETENKKVKIEAVRKMLQETEVKVQEVTTADSYLHRFTQAGMNLAHKDQIETRQSFLSNSNVFTTKSLMSIQSFNQFQEQETSHRYSSQMILFRPSMCTVS